jgi:hypothetical protein
MGTGGLTSASVLGDLGSSLMVGSSENQIKIIKH